jgi:twinkle protein
MLAQARWLSREAQLDGLIIDPWNKVRWDRYRGESTTEAIGRHLAEIVRFARAETVHVVIVAHPTKMEKAPGGGFKTPTLYDVSSSAEWFNQADFGLAVARGSQDGVEVHVEKVRRQPEWGRHGRVTMRFDADARLYTPDTPV